MKLEDQVCSLELAKRLKELGVQQNNVFYWVQGHDMDWNAQASTMPWKVSQITNGKDSFSAFTVAELGEMLPPDTDSGKSKNGYACWMTTSENGGETHWDEIIEDGKDLEIQSMRATTEADARAKMLIYLIEHNLVKP